MEKKVKGIDESVMIFDSEGRLSLDIGISKMEASAARGENLLSTLEHPRTNEWDWTYVLHQKKRENIYEEILLDFRDILIKNCDEVIEKNVEQLKLVVPNEKHFELMCNNRENLLEEYRAKLGITGQNIFEVLEIILKQIEGLYGEPLEMVENDLVGYAVVWEEEVLRQYSGSRDLDYLRCACLIENIGKEKYIMNCLMDMFWIWKDPERAEYYKQKIESYFGEETD